MCHVRLTISPFIYLVAGNVPETRPHLKSSKLKIFRGGGGERQAYVCRCGWQQPDGKTSHKLNFSHSRREEIDQARMSAASRGVAWGVAWRHGGPAFAKPHFPGGMTTANAGNAQRNVIRLVYTARAWQSWPTPRTAQGNNSKSLCSPKFTDNLEF